MKDASRLLLDRLNGARARMNCLQLNFAIGEMLMALTEAAAQRVTLREEHHEVLDEMRYMAADTWPTMLGFAYYKRDIHDIREHLLPAIDGYVPRAESMLAQLPYSSEKLGEVYDGNPHLPEVLNVLFADFEYPDFSHLSIDEVRAKYERQKRG